MTSADDGGLPAWSRVADWYLVRPDGYLAARGRAHDVEHLTRALARTTGRSDQAWPVTGVR